MAVSADLVALVQWLVNQGAAVAIALLVLWKLDTRLATLDKTAADLAAANRDLTEWLARHNGTPTSVPSK